MFVLYDTICNLKALNSYITRVFAYLYHFWLLCQLVEATLKGKHMGGARMGGGPFTDALNRHDQMRKEAEENRLNKPCSEYPGWVSVTIGVIQNAEEALLQLDAVGVTVEPKAADMVRQVNFSDQREEELDLVKPSIEEMGFRGEQTPEQIISTAEKQGMFIPPAEVAISLLIQNPRLLVYTSDWAVIPHKPINNKYFVLDGISGAQSLCASTTTPSTRWIRYHYWPGFTRFVFVRQL